MGATVEQLVLVVSVFWALSANSAFLEAALHDRAHDAPATWWFGAALLVMLVAVHALLVAPFANRFTVKPLLSLLIVVGASASFYADAFGVFMDPSMLRNVLRTDPGEAKELLSLRLAGHLLLFAGLPLMLLWWVRVRPRTWGRALGRRLAFIGLMLLALLIAMWSVFQPLSSLMRSQKELRYLITPANVVWSVGSVLAADAKGAAKPRQVIGEDASAGPSWAARSKPLVLIVVVGETARAANWGLSGYARNTTPRLADLGVHNFSNVTACGTNTETSLPCMFAPVGRRDYDEARIRGQQSLLHVAVRAGAQVHWLDNQSGCKGVCEGLPVTLTNPKTTPELCPDNRCLDEALVHDLDKRLAEAKGTQLWVLHMLGNHGPSYFRRYPPEFARFLPDCRKDDLQRCSVAELVNAYDNALLYTDHVLARAIERLRARASQVDSALIYLSDHGESLGENGLFLHGLPYAIAPDVQTKVPMVVWTSPGLDAASGLRPDCLAPQLKKNAAAALAHDHLFHTVLGLLDIRTRLHVPTLDLSAPCRGAPAGP